MFLTIAIAGNYLLSWSTPTCKILAKNVPDIFFCENKWLDLVPNMNKNENYGKCLKDLFLLSTFLQNFHRGKKLFFNININKF